MAPVSDVEASESGGVLSLDDCRCPICLEILMEPVTLPCTHTFCKDCFLESVDKAALCCPLCRRRVSTWARLNSRTNTLVDQQLWTRIQASFPRQCQRRLSGQDAEADLGASACCPRVSEPGELRQEYEDQVTKLTEEKQALEEEERRVSEEYIQRLLAEEEEELQEERRRREEDERLARLLSNQLNSAAVPPESPPPADVTPSVKKKKKKVEAGAGQMERFLCPRPAKSSLSDCSFMANKENILLSEEQQQAESLLSEPERRGNSSAPSLASVGGAETLRTPQTADHQPSSAKRKSSEQETPEDEEGGTKRVCGGSSSHCFSSLGEWVGAEREAELLQRRRQEEEDRRLAVLLQTELDQEERQRAPDRRKGSSDAYPLRHDRHSPDTPSRPPRKTTKTSSPSSAASVRTTNSSSSSSSTKQTTLTEMFSSLNS
ncbi:E3 ubiquitin-protein ligase rnf168 [Pempheris klunzingeri]|uniref:E3 ubiquitin-protein ligase rnf168 n=1 Tax=Pempheris klunzingeri TaxID=3127111 RepID=UPI0039818213